MRHAAALALATLLIAGCDAGKRAQAAGALEPVSSSEADSAFNAMDVRHGKAVGVDPMAMAHRFETTSQGGDIILERGVHDELGITQIRAHLLMIARSFARGNFAVPGFVHEKPVPGTSVMTQRANRISYSVEDLPHGGVVHIRTEDPEALQAIKSFIAFQISEHRTER
ncbi:MAG TPA: hypothetical protein VES88_01280 [Gemmatimonadaceae bacterium]|nr:hypothetical protein [Gemmatimonadaceae bacterium]